MITSIIPVYNLDQKRKRNLEFVYERLIDADIEVILAVQDKKIDSYYNKFKKAKILNFYKDQFNKSFVFNSCIKKINFNSNFILFLDADVFLPFSKLKEMLNSEDEIVQPFFDCFYINEEQTINFINNKEIDVNPETKKVFCLGSCALIIKKDLIKKIKFDEEFYSWGLEEVDLGSESKHLKIRNLVQPAIHLNHEKKLKRKIVHVFNCEKNFKKDVVESYINFSKNKNIELINCSEKNYLNESKVEFKQCNKYNQGYYFRDLIESNLDKCENDDWILFTDSDFQISEYAYADISNSNKSYIELNGCVLDDSKKFINSLITPNGFAFKKNLLEHFYCPKIFTKDKNFYEYISDYFKNIKKNNLDDSLIKIKNTAKNKTEKFYDSNNILYFSPHAPDVYSSGGDRLLKILKILKELNYNVYFLCNLAKKQECLDNLEKMNIPCYVRDENHLIGHLKKLKKEKNFNYVIFSWYDIAQQYMHIVKEMFPEIKIIIDTVDVHWKRELRGVEKKEISCDIEKLLEKKEVEKKIYTNADVVFAITKNDMQEIFKEIGYENNIKILSNIHDSQKTSLLGNDIIFIGNFEHTPNISAAQSSIEIYKKFLKTETYKNLSTKPKLYIVGKNITNKIKNLCDNQNCIALGLVEDLDYIYKKIKVSISPLTWGSGIKGKICDAASRGKIILTTDIGNEGIDLIDGVSGFIANTEEEFLKKLIEIYSTKNLEYIANKGKETVQNLVSFEAAKSVLLHTLFAKTITIVIVTYNKKNDLERCINSIIKNTEYPNYRILVYDNNSTDETENFIKKLQKEFDKIDYIKSQQNEYFVIPNNKVMKEEKYKDSDVVLINNDIEIISKCWLSDLYSTAYSENDICAVGGKILYPDYSIAEAGAELYKDGTGKNIGRGFDRNHSEYNYRRSVGYCSGCLLYMRRDAINKIGVFDEDFIPMYYEESEWQYRAHVNGLKTIYQPKVVAIHHEDKFKEMKKHQKINKNKFLNKYIDKNIEQYN